MIDRVYLLLPTARLVGRGTLKAVPGIFAHFLSPLSPSAAHQGEAKNQVPSRTTCQNSLVDSKVRSRKSGPLCTTFPNSKALFTQIIRSLLSFFHQRVPDVSMSETSISPRQSQDFILSLSPDAVPIKPQPTSRPSSRQLSRQSSATSLMSSSHSDNSDLRMPSYMMPRQPMRGYNTADKRNSQGVKNLRRGPQSNLSVSHPSYEQIFVRLFRPPTDDSALVDAPPALSRPESEMPYSAMITSTIKLGKVEGTGRLGNEDSVLFSPRSHLRGQVISMANGKTSAPASAGLVIEGRRSPSVLIGDDGSGRSFLRGSALPHDLRASPSTKPYHRTISELRSNPISEARSEPKNHEVTDDPPEQMTPESTRKAWSGRPIYCSQRNSSQPFGLASSRERDSPLPAPPPSLFTSIPRKKSTVRAGGFHGSPSSPLSPQRKGPDPLVILQQLTEIAAVEEDQDLMSRGGARPLELFHRPKSWAAELPPWPTLPFTSHAKNFKGRPPSSSNPSNSPFLRNMSELLNQGASNQPSDMTSLRENALSHTHGASTRAIYFPPGI